MKVSVDFLHAQSVFGHNQQYFGSYRVSAIKPIHVYSKIIIRSLLGIQYFFLIA